MLEIKKKSEQFFRKYDDSKQLENNKNLRSKILLEKGFEVL